MTQAARAFYSVTLVISLISLIWSIGFIVNREYVVQNEGYLYHFNRAKQATSVGEASTHLHLATHAMESEHVTNGYTAPWSQAPEYNIGLFFNSLKELEMKLDTSATRSQETVLSEFHIAAGALVVPKNIAIVPYLVSSFVWLIVSLLWACYTYNQLNGENNQTTSNLTNNEFDDE